MGSENVGGWSEFATPGQPMGNPIPDDLASGVSEAAMSDLVAANKKLEEELTKLASARADLKIQVELLKSGIAVAEKAISTLLPLAEKLMGHLQRPEATPPTSETGGAASSAGILNLALPLLKTINPSLASLAQLLQPLKIA